MYGDADRVCPMESVEWMMATIGHMVYGNYQFGGYDHADFGRANDSAFMEELHEALSHLQPHEGPYHRDLMFSEDLEHALEAEYAHQEFEIHQDMELDHLEPVFAEGYHEVESEPSWRDDHYHDHSGFDLPRDGGEEHHEAREEQREDGVEHFDNERLHQGYGQFQSSYGQQYLQ